MDDRRGLESRLNGNMPRNSPLVGSSAMSHGRQFTADFEQADLSQFRLTRILGEAMYQYSRMRDAEYEVRMADGDYQRQQQYFDGNPKLRETMESRKTKTERNFSTARADYAKAAKDAEPLLRRLNTENIPPKDLSPRLDEETVRKVVQYELRSLERTFVRFRDLEAELDKVKAKLAREFSRPDDVKQLLKKYVWRTDFDKLSEQVRALSVRGRQASVSSDTSRDLDQRLVQNREFDQIRAEFRGTTDQLTSELAMLKGLFNSMQRDHNLQPGRRIQMDAKSEDVVKIEVALERAQEVINDQYVTIQDIQLQVNSVIEGVRILNEHIEEYDKRLDGVQASTDKFFNEVQAENGKRNTIICQTLDTMYDKIATEISAKFDSPISPASASFGDSPRMGFQAAFPNNNIINNNNVPHVAPVALATVNQQLDNHAKLVNDLQIRVNQQQTQLMNYQHHANTVLPGRVQMFCDDVSSRLKVYQTDQSTLLEQIRQLEAALGNTQMALQKHVANSDNNFKETAIHMDSVKKRFAEHRKQLETLITAVKDIAPKTDQLIDKYEKVKDYLSIRILQRIVDIENAFPDVFGSNNNDTQGAMTGVLNGSTERGSVAPTAPVLPPQEREMSQDGGGGAHDPIEL